MTLDREHTFLAEDSADNFDRYDLGTFEGFNFRENSAIERNLTAAEVIRWEHDQHGEAEFWPSGDRPEISTLWTNGVTGAELRMLYQLLDDLGTSETTVLKAF